MARKPKKKVTPPAAGPQTKAPPAFDGGQTIGRGFEQTHRRETTGPFEPDPGSVAHREDNLVAGSTYVVGEELGRGGMGSVSRARQSSLHRDVAVKRLKASRASDPEMRESFVAEALITGMLDHPNIVPVHDLLQTEDGLPALAMKAVGGHSWLEVLHPTGEAMRLLARSTTREDHLETLITVCNAVAFAHSRGILHRDLKPSNVMLGEFGEVLVMDWGMAVVFAAREDHAPALEPFFKDNVVKPAGSPGYMAPEMALGRGDAFGPWTDVYLLGAILHEILSGRMPHEGDTATKVLKAAASSEPPEFGPDVPAELADICRRAMARKMAHRYQSVRELQKALKDYLLHVQSHQLVLAAEKILADVQQDWDGRSALTPARRTVVYQALDEAGAMWRQARVLWEGNTDAHDGELRTRLLHGRLAFSCADYGVAQAHLTGVESDEATQIRRGVLAAIAQREKAEHTTTLIRRGAVAGTVLMLVALAVGFVIVSLEKGRADQNARDATALADKARRNLERAEAGERQAVLNAQRAQENAARVEGEARARIAALEAGEKQRARADTEEARADAKTAEALENARLAEQRGREAEERAREAEAALAKAQLAEAEAREAMRVAELANLEKAQAIEEGRQLADAQIVGRLLTRGERLLASEGADREGVEAWLHKAARVVERHRAHEDALISVQLDASQRMPGRTRDLRKLRDLLDERDELAVSGKDARRLERVHELLDQLRKKTRGPTTGYDFPGEEERWHYGVLLELVANLKKLADPRHGLLDRVRRQRDLAVTSAAADRSERSFDAATWKKVRAAIKKDPRYGGLELAPRKDLLPLGPDPKSGLHEFLHLPSHDGPTPVRGEQGHLGFSGATGVVFVLVPGGAFSMGAQRKDPIEKNFDPSARRDEGPVHEVTLAPFFVSKYEMTQGQWLRLTGDNPSRITSADNLRLPVENVTWDACAALAARGLGIPTEAQWEYAARAGHGGPWPVSEEELATVANLGDQSLKAKFPTRKVTAWDDGHPFHAPVGSFAPNPFGLYDTVGNVAEWCLDQEAAYTNPVAPGTGERQTSGGRNRIFRGGSYLITPNLARLACRGGRSTDFTNSYLGLRPILVP